MKNLQSAFAPFLLVFSLFCSTYAFSNVKVARIFSDNMVLQRGINVPVWGTANPGEKIVVKIGEMVASGVADTDGKWQLYLPKFSAGGPYTLVINGENEIVFSDVMFGDVWVAGGQSNMSFRLENANNGAEEAKGANYPEIRLFTVPRRVSDVPTEDLEGGQWDRCTPEVAKNFSAVAYFFGRDIQKDLNVPIGLISCNWGGTPAEAWTSKEILEAVTKLGGSAVNVNFEDGWGQDVEANNKRAEEKSEIISSSYLGLESGVHKINYNSTDWPVVIAPNWDEELKGVVWLRKVLEVSKEFKGNELKFDLGRMGNNATVYFNEQELGKANAPNFSEFTVPGKLVKSGKNVIAVRLAHGWGNPNFLGPEERMKLYAPSGAVLEDLAGPWKYNANLEPALPEVKGYTHYPSSLYNGMLAPIIPYGIKGAIWYQGETNAGRAYAYRALFQAMIEDWRMRWEIGYFPFLFVQLANYMDTPEQPQEDSWAELREAQLMALRLPNTGMAVTIDIGEQFDIHPKNKQDVGERLALAAKKVAYNQDIVYSGPLYKSMEINGNDVEISFENVGNGLMAKGDGLTGFQIAGADKKYYWADAQIVGGKVFVSSDKVKKPEAVRYGWASNPKCNLYNKNGLPASPFRTDDWPGKTKPK